MLIRIIIDKDMPTILAGKKFSHWDVRTRRGAVDLHSFTYIVIEKPGIYHIYSQVDTFCLLLLQFCIAFVFV